MGLAETGSRRRLSGGSELGFRRENGLGWGMDFRISRIGMFAAWVAGAGLGWGQTVFINEFHYDNAGSDVEEGVEVAGPAGTNLAGYSVVFYNGSTGAVYNTVSLSGVLPNEGATGFGAVWVAVAGLQNDVDGMALVRNSGGAVVVQHFSYEGTFTGVGGAADGLVFNPLSVSEPASPAGQTLQLRGTGTQAGDFVWEGPAAGSRGLLNAGQTFGASAKVAILSVLPGLAREGGTATATLTLFPAPSAPVLMNLNSMSPGVAGVPGNVVVPTGGTVTFSVTLPADGVADGFQETVISAVDGSGNYGPGAAAVQVVDADRPALSAAGAMRMMTLNVRLGVGAPGSEAFAAVREAVERISPDVLLLQEVSDAGDFGDVKLLLAQAGFPEGSGFVATRGDAFAAAAYSSGDFGTGECQVTASRFPILESVQIGRDHPERRELTRFPLYTRIDAPGSLPDLHVVNVHLKAGTEDTDRFRKAVEAYRIREFLSQRGLDAAVDAVFVAGDFNAIDTIFLSPLSYNTAGYVPPAGTSLPVAFLLGSDLSQSPGITLPYSVAPYNGGTGVYPHVGFNPAGLFAPVLRLADGSSTTTFNSFDARFDYLMFPQRFQTAGRMRGEVYSSRLESQADGLPKRPTLPRPELSEMASDHFAVFVDVNLEAAAPQGLSLSVSPDNLDEVNPGAGPVATVSLSPPPAGPVTVFLGMWRGDGRVRFAVDRVVLTPGQPSVQVPVSVPYSPEVEPQRTVVLTAEAEGFAPGYAGLTVRSAEPAGLLVFSQYVEPAATAGPAPNNNLSRALELFNASGKTLDLARAKWAVRRFTNGSLSPSILGKVSAVVPDGSAALLPAGGVVVVGDAAVGDFLVAAGMLAAPAGGFAAADTGTLFANAAGDAVFLKGSSMDFNGDDALEIVLDGVRCDVFGKIGQDPGTAWTGGPGNASSADQNLSLRPEIFTGSRGFTLPGTRFLTTAAGNALTGIGTPPVPGDRYLTWAAAKGLSGVDRAPDSDPDGDDRLNLMEFVQETDPLLPDAAAAESGSVFPIPGGGVGGSFATLSADAWLRLAWEGNAGLGTGWAAAPEISGAPEGAGRTRWTWSVVPGPAAGRRFWRLRADRP
ncbi:MAG: endonuclease/exonuclease/phosphatase [Verrucomicrobiales bacterium]|nr:endonuclease/exonuclease/phosphatase [Verrucomicrobiales bacterium]